MGSQVRGRGDDYRVLGGKRSLLYLRHVNISDRSFLNAKVIKALIKPSKITSAMSFM
jgi:hypothetical protein